MAFTHSSTTVVSNVGSNYKTYQLWKATMVVYKLPFTTTTRVSITPKEEPLPGRDCLHSIDSIDTSMWLVLAVFVLAVQAGPRCWMS